MPGKTRYNVANYGGGFSNTQPISGEAGSLQIDGMRWTLKLGRRKIKDAFETWPFEVQALDATSCRVTVRNVRNPRTGITFDLLETSAATLNADLRERGCGITEIMDDAGERAAKREQGAWWVDLKPYRILIGCHYSGAKNKGESGPLQATAQGIEYKAFLGSKVKIPWSVIQDIEVSTQSSRRVSAGRVLAVGVFALAAKKNETFTYIHISDKNTVFSFAAKTSQGKVLQSMRPILDAFNSRAQPQRVEQPRPIAPPAPAAPTSVADELAKLAQLKADGILTDDEFAAQKAKLLS